MKQVLRSVDSNKKEKGQSFVELSVSLIFILILLSAVVDLGRLYFTFIAIRDAAQEGAAYGSICPFDDTGMEVRVRSSSTLPVNLLNKGDIEVEIFRDNLEGEISIRVKHKGFRLSMPFLGGVTVPLSAIVTDTILSYSLDCPL